MSLIAIISPAKTQNFSKEKIKHEVTQARFQAESKQLVNELKKLSEQDIQTLMGVSSDLAHLNKERFAAYAPEFTEQNAKAAMYAFEGDVYKSLEKKQYSAGQLSYAQKHLRILSGLYGLLRPLDLIQPYRLEMKTPLATQAGKNLYQFWDTKLTDTLNKDLEEIGGNTLINLASNEYSKALQLKKLNAKVITPQFKDYKDGKLKTIAIFAKQARGSMANYIIINKLQKPEKLKLFDAMGYSYDAKASTDTTWLFTR
jgi:cytoplasmic iron level regulating protein YaaA (DUF328/UPF0246 family)